MEYEGKEKLQKVRAILRKELLSKELEKPSKKEKGGGQTENCRHDCPTGCTRGRAAEKTKGERIWGILL